MWTDFVLNGQATGEVAQQFAGVRFDPGMLRPYINRHGKRAVTACTGRMIYNNQTGRHTPERKEMLISDLMARGIYSPVFNATTLRKEQWIELDKKVQLAYRNRLTAWADLAAAATYGGFNAMGRMTLEYEAMSDPGEAIVDMNGISEGRSSQPLFSLRSLPLPITHMDVVLDRRRLAISQNDNMPIDTTMIEAATRRVAESVENTTTGVVTGPTWGTQSTGVTAHTGSSAVYGYINFPYRLTKTNLTIPTGANPQTTVDEVLAMRDQLFAANRYGPFILYHSTDWDRYLDNDYAFTNSTGWAAAPNKTLRQRLKEIEGIQDVRRLDNLTAANSHAFTLVMVEMTAENAEAIDGMQPTVVQWETKGGMQINLKVMAIQVPRLKYDYAGNCGILHARTA